MKISYSKILFFIFLPILVFSYSRGVSSNNALLILTTVASIVSSFLIFQLVFLATKNKLYAVLSLLIFISLGVLHMNFISPIIFAIMFGLLTCFLLLHFENTEQQKYLFLAGVAAFIAAIFYKYLIFAILIAPLVFTAFYKKGRFVNSFTILYGFIWGFIVSAVYLIISNSFPLFVESYILYSGFNLTFKTPDSQTFILFFIQFVLIFLSLFVLFKRRRFNLLFLPCFVGIFSLSIIPNLQNPSYLDFAASLSGILLSILMRFSANSTIKTACIIFSALLILGGAIIK